MTNSIKDAKNAVSEIIADCQYAWKIWIADSDDDFKPEINARTGMRAIEYLMPRQTLPEIVKSLDYVLSDVITVRDACEGAGFARDYSTIAHCNPFNKLIQIEHGLHVAIEIVKNAITS